MPKVSPPAKPPAPSPKAETPVLSTEQLLHAIDTAMVRLSNLTAKPERILQANALTVLMSSSAERHAALAMAGLSAARTLLTVGAKATDSAAFDPLGQ